MALNNQVRRYSTSLAKENGLLGGGHIRGEDKSLSNAKVAPPRSFSKMAGVGRFAASTPPAGGGCNRDPLGGGVTK